MGQRWVGRVGPTGHCPWVVVGGVFLAQGSPGCSRAIPVPCWDAWPAGSSPEPGSKLERTHLASLGSTWRQLKSPLRVGSWRPASLERRVQPPEPEPPSELVEESLVGQEKGARAPCLSPAGGRQGTGVRGSSPGAGGQDDGNVGRTGPGLRAPWPTSGHEGLRTGCVHSPRQDNAPPPPAVPAGPRLRPERATGKPTPCF